MLYRIRVVRTGLFLFAALLLGAAGRPCAAQISFAAPVNYTVGQKADAPHVADFDGDGNLDIAIANGGEISILYGNGDGTFQPPVNYDVGAAIWEILDVDVNLDGKPDLVAAVAGGNEAAVLINKGNRVFAPVQLYPVGT
ncbi:MAG TPA: VCBS repeat-containing protein [Chthonomonadaceae bacterium]|nr:VCBS repeat-containing protein [Chthonomonadaceae bacterium]